MTNFDQICADIKRIKAQKECVLPDKMQLLACISDSTYPEGNIAVERGRYTLAEALVLANWIIDLAKDSENEYLDEEEIENIIDAVETATKANISELTNKIAKNLNLDDFKTGRLITLIQNVSSEIVKLEQENFKDKLLNIKKLVDGDYNLEIISCYDDFTIFGKFRKSDIPKLIKHLEYLQDFEKMESTNEQ